MNDKYKDYIKQFLAAKSLSLASSTEMQLIDIQSLSKPELLEFTECLLLLSAQNSLLLKAAVKSLAPYIGNGLNELDRTMQFDPHKT